MQQNIKAGGKIIAGMEEFVYYGGLIHQTESMSFEGIWHFREMLNDYPAPF